MKRLLISLAALTTMLVPLSYTSVGAIDINHYLCLGINFGKSADCSSTADGEEDAVVHIARNIVDALTLIVGIISVIMIIFGGLRYIVSGGDSAKVTGAKNTLLYAIVGLLIAISAQELITFITANFSNSRLP